jgi:hypothetical protein
MDDSPPDFIVIRTPPAARSPERIYRVALDLVEHVHQVLEAAEARFHLKDRLDKSTSALALHVSRAQIDQPSLRWRSYRAAIDLLLDVTTLLDIVARQKATTNVAALEAGRRTARRMMRDLRPLAGLAV